MRRVPVFWLPQLVELASGFVPAHYLHMMFYWWFPVTRTMHAYDMETVITPESISSYRVTWGAGKRPRGKSVLVQHP